MNELGIPRSLWEEFGLKEGEPLLFNRAPTFRASSVLALMPYPVEEPVLRMHPLLCYWMDADFDGDQAALYQPVGEEMREEVMQTLTPAAHLTRDPSLVSSLLPRQESLLGLYLLEKERGGRKKLNQILGHELPARASLVKQLEETYSLILREEGGEELISLAGQVFSLGLDRAACRGHSMSPLIGSGGENLMKADLTELIEGGSDEECRSFLPQRDAVLSGARGSCRQLGQLLGPIGSASLPDGREFPVKGNRWSGLDGEAFHKMAAGMRQGLLVLSRDYGEGSFRFMSEYNISMDYNPRGHAFLARAMRSDNPGRVFAHAAANGEVDPLTDPWAAVFCGKIPR